MVGGGAAAVVKGGEKRDQLIKRRPSTAHSSTLPAIKLVTVNICWNLTENKAAGLSVRHELPVWESAPASLIWSVMADQCGRGLIIVVGRAFLLTGHGHTSLLGSWFAFSASSC